MAEACDELLRELWLVRESYYGSRKEDVIESMIGKALVLASEVPERGLASYLRGRALDAREGYVPQAEEELSRAVKLCPEHIDAWNALGHVFWKKQAHLAAEDCFLNARNVRSNGDSLRALSMLARPKDFDKSVSLAKEAVSIDVGDARSWYVLGNACVARYFHTRIATNLRDALKAYALAETKLTIPSERSGLQFGHPDLYFNRGHLKAFLQDYTGAISDFEKANALDPSLRANEMAQDLHRFSKRCADLVSRKGGLKTKKRNDILSSLPKSMHYIDPSSDPLAGILTNSNSSIDIVIALEIRTGAAPPDVFLAFAHLNSALRCLLLAVYDADTSELAPGVACTLNKATLLCALDDAYDVLRVTSGDDVIVHATRKPLPRSLKAVARSRVPGAPPHSSTATSNASFRAAHPAVLA